MHQHRQEEVQLPEADECTSMSKEKKVNLYHVISQHAQYIITIAHCNSDALILQLRCTDNSCHIIVEVQDINYYNRIDLVN